MMVSDKKTIPDFFNDHHLDPVSVATGRSGSRPAASKRKAGFYFSEALIERFNRKFHQLKLDGVPIENKSALAESALAFALDDMDLDTASQLLRRLRHR